MSRFLLRLVVGLGEEFWLDFVILVLNVFKLLFRCLNFVDIILSLLCFFFFLLFKRNFLNMFLLVFLEFWDIFVWLEEFVSWLLEEYFFVKLFKFVLGVFGFLWLCFLLFIFVLIGLFEFFWGFWGLEFCFSFLLWGIVVGFGRVGCLFLGFRGGIVGLIEGIFFVDVDNFFIYWFL